MDRNNNGTQLNYCDVPAKVDTYKTTEMLVLTSSYKVRETNRTY